MTFRTNQFYCLLCRHYFKQLLWQGIFIAFWVIIHLLDEEPNLLSMLDIIPFLLFVNLIIIGNQPKAFTIENDRILYTGWLRKERRYAFVKSSQSNKKVSLFIRRVTKIEVTYHGYRKAQRVASFRIYGEIHAKNRHDQFVEDVIIPPYADLYGVLDAEGALNALHSAYPEAEITETNRCAK